MKRKPVGSDTERLKLITNLAAHPEITNPNGAILLDTETMAALQTLIASFGTTLEERKQSIYARREARQALTRKLTDLETTVRVFWRTVRGWVTCGKADPACFVLHGLSTTGTQPSVSSERNWIAIAKQVVNGNTVAEGQGLPAMDQAERENLLQIIETVTSQIETLEQKKDGERAALRRLIGIRTEVDHTVRDVVLQIERAFLGHEPVDKRETMKILGFAFQSDQPEEPETKEVA